jgi:hypothetical protein
MIIYRVGLSDHILRKQAFVQGLLASAKCACRATDMLAIAEQVIGDYASRIKLQHQPIEQV